MTAADRFSATLGTVRGLAASDAAARDDRDRFGPHHQAVRAVIAHVSAMDTKFAAAACVPPGSGRTMTSEIALSEAGPRSDEGQAAFDAAHDAALAAGHIRHVATLAAMAAAAASLKDMLTDEQFALMSNRFADLLR